MITSGTDRKICYWEIFDGSMIRELEGSKSGSVNAMDISREGSQFVTGGDDKLIKVLYPEVLDYGFCPERKPTHIRPLIRKPIWGDKTVVKPR